MRTWHKCALLFLTVPGLPLGLYSSMKMSVLNAGRSEVWLEHHSVRRCAWLSGRSTHPGAETSARITQVSGSGSPGGFAPPGRAQILPGGSAQALLVE